jgi:hypothetical protein
MGVLRDTAERANDHVQWMCVCEWECVESTVYVEPAERNVTCFLRGHTLR